MLAYVSHTFVGQGYFRKFASWLGYKSHTGLSARTDTAYTRIYLGCSLSTVFLLMQARIVTRVRVV
jgi:hypothetical protein